jgi:hypothetical protein
MYKKKCDYCKEKDVFVYGKSKDGTLPIAYCSKQCEANSKYDKRFDVRFKNS